MKIVLAFDSFKGSLTAEQAVTATREGVLAACPRAEVVSLPLADGGEGTTEVLCHFKNARWTTCHVHDPLFRPIEAHYAISCDGATAIMEMASSAGLTLLSDAERNPMATTTFGVGEMILDALKKGCRHILMGIGGSATNDGGMGMLSALGMQFINEKGKMLQPVGANLAQIAKMDRSGLIDLKNISIEVICDVRNPLYGKNGAAYVYAPQKGACTDEIELLDKGLQRMEEIAGIDGTLPGSGAAGGLGYGFLLLGGWLRQGIDVVLDAANIDFHLQKADLVLTGEGKIDRQTLNGKLPFGVLQRAQAQTVPVIALAGIVEDGPLLLQAGFHAVHTITPVGQDKEKAMNPLNAINNLKVAAEKAVRLECITNSQLDGTV